MKRKPTVSWVEETLSYLKKHNQAAVSEMQKDEEYYLGKISGFKLPPHQEGEGGERQKTLIAPLATDIVDTPVSRLFLKWPSFETGGNDDVRNLCRGLYYYWSQSGHINPIRQGAQYQYGVGCVDLQVLFIKHRADIAIERREAESEDEWSVRRQVTESATGYKSPIYLRAPHPCNVFYDPSPEGPKYVFEEQKRLVTDIQVDYPAFKPDEPKEIASFVTYFDDTWFGYFADGKPLLKGEFQKHGYGFLPYDRVYAGFGHVDAERRPEHMAKGIIRMSRDVIWAYTRSLNQIVSVHDFIGWPAPGIIGGAESGVEEIPIFPGKATLFPAGVEVKDLMPQKDTTQIMALMNTLAGAAYEAGAPGPVRGVAVPGSGFKQQLIQGAGATRYVYATQAYEMLIAKKMMQALAILYNRVKSPITFWGQFADNDDAKTMTIDPAKLQPPFHIRVTFNTQSPQDDDRKAVVGMQLSGTGAFPSENPALSAVTVRQEYLGVQDNKAEEERLNKQRLMNSVTARQLEEKYLAEILEQEHQDYLFEEALRAVSKAIPTGNPLFGMPAEAAPPMAAPAAMPGPGVPGAMGEMQPESPNAPFAQPAQEGSYQQFQEQLAALKPR